MMHNIYRKKTVSTAICFLQAEEYFEYVNSILGKVIAMIYDNIGQLIGRTPMVRLHLNKLMAFNIQHFFMPPFTPFLCIELGYFLRHGVFLKEFTAETLFRQGLERIWEWLLGSLVLAPVFAVLTGSIVYGTAALCCNICRRRRNL